MDLVLPVRFACANSARSANRDHVGLPATSLGGWWRRMYDLRVGGGPRKKKSRRAREPSRSPAARRHLRYHTGYRTWCMVVLERPDRLLLLHQLDPSGPAAGYNPVHVFSPTCR